MWQDHYSLHGHRFKYRGFCVHSKVTSDIFNKAVSCFTRRDFKQVSLPVDDLGITACHRVSKGNPIMVPPRKRWFMGLGIWGERVDAVICSSRRWVFLGR